MVSKSSLIGFGAGALLAGGIAFFSLDRQPAPVAEPPRQAPLVESSSTVVEPAHSPLPDPVAPAAPKALNRARPVAKASVRPTTVAPQEPVAIPAVAAPAPPKAVEPAPPPPAPVVAAAPDPPKKAAPAPPPPPNTVTISAGTNLSIRLNDSLASDVVQQGQTFHATLDQPLVVGDFVIAERGARVDGRVIDVVESGRVKGVASLSLELTHLRTSDGQRVAVNTAAVERTAEKNTKSDATKVAVGAGVGAALGAIFGGGKGAAIGSAAGGGAGAGTVLATRGKPVVLPAETRLSFALRAPVTVTEKK